jgi:hypothetical protein
MMSNRLDICRKGGEQDSVPPPPLLLLLLLLLPLPAALMPEQVLCLGPADEAQTVQRWKKYSILLTSDSRWESCATACSAALLLLILMHVRSSKAACGSS